MTSYTTHKKPSFMKTLLAKLGLVELLHSKVNCWFCNQDCYIIPGGRNTVNNWYCHICENRNVLDQNGDIMDPSPEYYSPTKVSTVPLLTPSNSNMLNTEKELCEDCQRKQDIICNSLRNIDIPDESDPNYEEACEAADEEERRLHRAFKICERCQRTVDKVVKHQQDVLKFRNIQRAVLKKDTKHLPIVISRKRLYWKRVVWYLTHFFTLLFVVFCLVLPPKGNVAEYITSTYKTFKFSNPTTITNNIIDHIITTSKSFISCLFNADFEEFEWYSTDYLLILTLINMVTIYSVDWHPWLTPLIYTESKNKPTMKKYKSLQLALLSIRMFGIFTVNYSFAFIFLGISYTGLYTYAISLVKPEGFMRPLQNTHQVPEPTNDPYESDVTMEEVEQTPLPALFSVEADPVESIAYQVNQIAL